MKKKIKTFSFEKMKEGKWYRLPEGKEIKIPKKKLKKNDVILCGEDWDVFDIFKSTP